MVARDWRGGKVFYREWSKLAVERTLGALNGEGSWEELAAGYSKTSRRMTHPLQTKTRKGHPGKRQSQDQLKALRVIHPPAARKLAIRLYWMLRTNTGYLGVVRVESSSRVALVGAS